MSQVAEPTPSARLLVVEDDDTIRETVAEALEMEGFARHGRHQRTQRLGSAQP